MRLFLALLSCFVIYACGDDTKAPVSDAKVPTEATVLKKEAGAVLEAAAPIKEAGAVTEAAVPASDAKPAAQ